MHYLKRHIVFYYWKGLKNSPFLIKVRLSYDIDNLIFYWERITNTTKNINSSGIIHVLAFSIPPLMPPDTIAIVNSKNNPCTSIASNGLEIIVLNNSA